MIRFTIKEVTDILNYAVIATDDYMSDVMESIEFDTKVTEYINAKLEAKQIQEDNKSLRRTL